MDLLGDLHELGVRPGDMLMVHVSLRAVGPVAGGPPAVLAALDQAVGPDGTLLMILGAKDVPEWTSPPSAEEAAVPEVAARAFDAGRTPAHPEMGWFAEVFRAAPGTDVTSHPLGRFGARGRRAEWLLHDAPWHDYYGPGSPLDRFTQAGGRVVRLGADLNTVTLLHWAEYLAPLPDKRRLRRWAAVTSPEGVAIRHVDALDDATGIVDWDGEDYFTLLMSDYLATGRAQRGRVGNATSEVLEGGELVGFAVEWMARHLGARSARRAP
jgi:aminoglycoside 3-N-acetyltransferase